MPNIKKRSVLVFVLALVCLSPAFADGAEKKGWDWNRLNPFHRDDTPSVRRPATRKIVPNRFKPTRSATKPKKSPWQAVSDGTRKMVDGTRRIFNLGDSKKTDSARNRVAPTLADKPVEKKENRFTSWLPWSKTKKR